MSLLEDRILRILELRKDGNNEQSIAEVLGIATSIVTSYESSTRNAIERAKNAGVDTPQAISKLIGLSPIVVEMFMKHYRNEQDVQAIKGAIDQGASTVREIAKKVKLPRDYVAMLIRSEASIPLFWERRLQAIQRLLNNKSRSIKDICETVRIKPGTLYFYAEQGYINWPHDMSPYQFKPEIDELIPNGWSLEKIGGAIGKTKQYVLKYLHESGQHDIWLKARRYRVDEEKNAIYNARTDLIRVLNATVDRKAELKGWPYQKVVEYIRSLSSIKQSIGQRRVHERPNLDHLVVLFTRYEEAKNSGRKISSEELGEGIGLFASSVAKILKRVGLEPFYGTRERHTVPKEKKDAIKRAYYSEMPAPDIAFFLSIPDYDVSNYFYNIGKGRSTTPSLGPKGIRLPFRLASQIYDAEDLGFKPNEIAELLNTEQKMAQYALEHRTSIASRIMTNLKIIFPTEDINRPYLRK